MFNLILGFVVGVLVAVVYASIKPNHFQKLRLKVLGWLHRVV